ncbi:MAG: lipase maturation factor family protein [Nannocystaceae bacterium]
MDESTARPTDASGSSPDAPPSPDDAAAVDDALARVEPPLRRALHRLWRTLEGPPGPTSYRRTRSLILRLLGVVYVAAFAGAVLQVVPLIGHHGLLPADLYLDQVRAGLGADAPWELPTLLWIDASDAALMTVSVVGLVLGLALLLGVEWAPLLLGLWVAQLSLVHVGQRFWAFGWETQLLETTLLAALLCPWDRLRPLDARDPPRVAIVLLRWLAFRIMIGAGLIKLRGDPCWHDLTCLDYHFETQPNPNPLSWYLHNAPEWLRHGGVLFNHLAELVAPFFVFGPRRLRHLAGAILVGFQASLILSGNLSFLNWLTIVPCLACFDDRLLARLLPRRLRARIGEASPPSRRLTILAWSFAALVAWRSVDVVVNLISPDQAMNRSFDRLHLVNTYGAFGRVTRERHELVIEGSPDASGDDAWRPYSLPCQPGDPRRRPCVITPYHLRLDWLMWFAGIEAGDAGALRREDWVIHLLAELLAGEPSITALLAVDPFAGEGPPRRVRVVLYRYHFTAPATADEGWWTREPIGVLIRPLSADDPELRAYLEPRGWLTRLGPGDASTRSEAP